jgi:bifunctional DNA-binding transcriptional regulator/antitoxin component of YhaV-PrlF toxin-antitoxin module
MMKSEKILGTTKVGPKYRITLINYVREKLKAEIGDLIIYVEDDKGNIVLQATKMR